MLESQEHDIPQVQLPIVSIIIMKDLSTSLSVCLFVCFCNYRFLLFSIQNTPLEMNAKKIQECEKRIKQLTDELETRKQKVEVRFSE